MKNALIGNVFFQFDTRRTVLRFNIVWYIGTVLILGLKFEIWVCNKSLSTFEKIEILKNNEAWNC